MQPLDLYWGLGFPEEHFDLLYLGPKKQTLKTKDQKKRTQKNDQQKNAQIGKQKPNKPKKDHDQNKAKPRKNLRETSVRKPEKN